MRKPQPMVRRFIVAMLLDNHGYGVGVKEDGLFEKDVAADWAPDWEAVKLTIKATGKPVSPFEWWSVVPELVINAESQANNSLMNMPLPDQIRKYS